MSDSAVFNMSLLTCDVYSMIFSWQAPWDYGLGLKFGGVLLIQIVSASLVELGIQTCSALDFGMLDCEASVEQKFHVAIIG